VTYSLNIAKIVIYNVYVNSIDTGINPILTEKIRSRFLFINVRRKQYMNLTSYQNDNSEGKTYHTSQGPVKIIFTVLPRKRK
jgi:hypothetical protein